MESPSDHFLDTSAVVDLEFRSPVLRQHVREIIPPDATLVSSHYVVFELARGFLRNLILLHNKATDIASFPQLVHYIKNSGIFARYRSQTMLGIYEDFSRYLTEDDRPLTETQRLAHFRTWLRMLIRRRWGRLASGYRLQNPIGCRTDITAPTLSVVSLPHEPIREHLDQTLPTTDCGKPNNCELLAKLRQHASNFGAIAQHLNNIPSPDEETKRRLAALASLGNHPPSQPFHGKECYACGDAIIAHESQEVGNAVLVTKNEKHFRPLCQALSLRLVSYKEPA